MDNEQFRGENTNPINSTQKENSAANGINRASTTLQDKKEQLVNQAKTWGQDLNGRLDTAREKTSHTLHTASEKIDQFASYIRENDSKDMMDSLQSVIRQHPGKSILIGLGLGMLFGRAFR